MSQQKDDEFTRRFRTASTDLERIKLAISEDRYTIWTRQDKPNFPEEYLLPILSLPAKHRVTRSPRKSGTEGFEYVVQLKYLFRGAGKSIPIYMKGYFSKDGHLVLGLEVQSLRQDD